LTESPAVARIYRISASAENDLEEIWAFIAQDSVDAADHFIEFLIGKFPLLTDFPRLGRARDELSPGLRSFPVKSYVIFYRDHGEVVEVVRVLSAARDIEALFD
jgi:toxin ParE1/3/4